MQPSRQLASRIVAKWREGCHCFFDRFHTADNPNLSECDVSCPAELMAELIVEMCSPSGADNDDGVRVQCERDCQ